MFQGPMFDVAIGATLLFLVSSLLASAIVETVGGFFHRRSKNLWDTIDLLLGKAEVGEGDDVRKLVDQIYREPFVAKLVQPKAQMFYPKANEQAAATPPDPRSYSPDLSVNARKRRFHGPQYIGSEVFAKAFVEAVRPNGNVEANLANLKAEVAKLPAAISKPVGALLAEAGDDFLDARKRIQDWYDAHMQAVSVWYRRQTRYFLFAAGLAIASGRQRRRRWCYRDPLPRRIGSRVGVGPGGDRRSDGMRRSGGRRRAGRLPSGRTRRSRESAHRLVRSRRITERVGDADPRMGLGRRRRHSRRTLLVRSTPSCPRPSKGDLVRLVVALEAELGADLAAAEVYAEMNDRIASLGDNPITQALSEVIQRLWTSRGRLHRGDRAGS